MQTEEITAAYEVALGIVTNPNAQLQQRAAYAQILQALGTHLLTAQVRELDDTLNHYMQLKEL